MLVFGLWCFVYILRLGYRNCHLLFVSFFLSGLLLLYFVVVVVVVVVEACWLLDLIATQVTVMHRVCSSQGLYCHLQRCYQAHHHRIKSSQIK